MTTLSTRIEALPVNADAETLAELGAEVMTLLTGEKYEARSWDASRDFPGGKVSVWKTEGTGNRLARNPLTDLNAVAKLELEYGGAFNIDNDRGEHVAIFRAPYEGSKDLHVYATKSCATEAYARTAALVRMKENEG